MPKPVDDLVQTLLEKPDFYPEKSENEQKAIAFAIAWKQYNKTKKKRKSSELMQNLKVANNLLSYCNKLDIDNKFAESDSLFYLAKILTEN
jgi:hypothetical protein